MSGTIVQYILFSKYSYWITMKKNGWGCCGANCSEEINKWLRKCYSLHFTLGLISSSRRSTTYQQEVHWYILTCYSVDVSNISLFFSLWISHSSRYESKWIYLSTCCWVQRLPGSAALDHPKSSTLATQIQLQDLLMSLLSLGLWYEGEKLSSDFSLETVLIHMNK